MLIVSSLYQDSSLVAREKAAGELVLIEKDDNAIIRRLQEEALQYDLLLNGGKRLECYILLNDQTSLWLLQTVGIPSEIGEKADVFATTIADLLAKTIFVKLPNLPSTFPSLDRMVITRNSETIVHLVIFGLSSQTEALAINAALVAHYPNYCKG